MPAKTNMERGLRAKRALEQYYRKRLRGDEIAVAAQDLMTDMMHLVRLTPGLPDWDEIADQARSNHDGERRDYPDGPKDWRPGMTAEE